MTDRQRKPLALLCEADQRTIAALVAICLTLILVNLVLQGYQRGQLIEIDDAPHIDIDFSLDVNEAKWPEFTLLPGIGETLARRIVDYREQHGPFSSIDDVESVKGIGPKTMRRIRGYLRVSEAADRNHKDVRQGQKQP